MSEISTNLILDGITLALRASYPNSHIESDTIHQGLTAPAFLVQLVSMEQVARVGLRWQRVPRFDVIYFPVNGKEECYATADMLCMVLELITLPGGDKIRGTDMSYTVEDDVLHFLISYHHFVCVQLEETAMGSFELRQGGN